MLGKLPLRAVAFVSGNLSLRTAKASVMAIDQDNGHVSGQAHRLDDAFDEGLPWENASF